MSQERAREAARRIPQREAAMREALRESRDALADQLETDVSFCCPRDADGEPDESQMDEASRPMIEQTRALIAKIDAALAAK